jgi:LysE type translocator
MTIEQALAFCLFALVAAITPGPSNLLLTSTGANVGVLRGLPCLCGVAIGMGLMMGLVAFGLGSLVLERPLILQGLKWGSVANYRKQESLDSQVIDFPIHDLRILPRKGNFATEPKIVLHQYDRSFELRTERTPLCRHTSRSQICVFRSHYNTRFFQKYQVM